MHPSTLTLPAECIENNGLLYYCEKLYIPDHDFLKAKLIRLAYNSTAARYPHRIRTAPAPSNYCSAITTFPVEYTSFIIIVEQLQIVENKKGSYILFLSRNKLGRISQSTSLRTFRKAHSIAQYL
ncbi:hypothetical protein OCU04_012632 [Sclerotinia nivalis]|uniref:Uncharacterized protein n=1 Tax=Sclerotinia nivalis TaxID=352851 RepID=A0A9X0DF29_9HELO|nr:hypothetical protein OCU04_012632 [Sclerotinia nivalis]